MKGVITEINDSKSIVLFNDGKVGSIPTPKNARVGTMIKVSKSSGRIFVFAALIVALVVAFFIGRSIYNAPQGFLNISSENIEIEFTYNSFERIISARPLTQEAADFLAENSLQHEDIDNVFSPFFNTENNIFVNIADDNLERAQEIENNLSKLPAKRTPQFKIFTVELYRKNMKAERMGNFAPRHKNRHGRFRHPPF